MQGAPALIMSVLVAGVSKSKAILTAFKELQIQRGTM